jgi:hypothetical protein
MILLPRTSREKLLLLGSMGITALIHAPALMNHLVADSWFFVAKWPFIETFRYFTTSIIPPEWHALWLRPIPMFLFWLDSLLWPNTEWGPHLMNIIFHVINVWLIWLIIGFIRADSHENQTKNNSGLPAVIASLVYGIHPITVGSVSWVAARFDVMSVTFGLAGLLMWLKWDRDNESWDALSWGGFFLVLSLLSKEQGIVYLMVCLSLSMYHLLVKHEGKRKHWIACLTLISIIGLYAIWRINIFQGIGGYVTAPKGLSIIVPISYLVVILFPYLNIFPDWVFLWTVGGSVLLLSFLIMIVWNMPVERKKKIVDSSLIVIILIFVFGLLTTAPHQKMTFGEIVGHMETRFALIALSGIALTIGIVVGRIASSKVIMRVIVVLFFVWSVMALWRTNVQIQAWRDAGDVMKTILDQTHSLVPNPPLNSHLLFIHIPVANDQYAYISGVGLKAALHTRYQRQDLVIVQAPKKEDFQKARAERDFVFEYHAENRTLEKLRAVKANDVQKLQRDLK